MRIRLLKLLDELRASYWFIPSLMVVFAVGLAFGMVAFDRWRQGLDDVPSLGWTFEGGHDGAREVLGVIASSMITVAGVTFSITIVAFSLAAGQFGPRVLRNLMRDRGNQVTLGTFVSTFVYALLVQRTVRGSDGSFVPDTAVTVGVLLALASIAVFVYFVHHAAESIQAPVLLARVGRELCEAIDTMVVRAPGHRAPPPEDRLGEPALPSGFDADRVKVLAPGDGYVQAIDVDALLARAATHDLVIRIERRPGRFVTVGEPVLSVWPGDAASPHLEALGRAVVVGQYRTQTQDPMFALNQLLQVALRALSPSLNDPFTAVTAIDWISAGLSRLVAGPLPRPGRCDGHGVLRVAHDIPTAEELFVRAFEPLRQAARGDPLTVVHLLGALERIARHAWHPTHRALLAAQLDAVYRETSATVAEPSDRLALSRAHAAVVRALDAPPGGSGEVD